jgi:eukaryotic-like serine/threonine-protein kinase
MTAEQWQRARDLFERALDDDPSDVGGWLAREASDDPAVKAEVASLLQHHTRAGAFLSEPISARLTDLLDEAPRFEAGRAIGPYIIVREIGRGGMGRVYLATDSRLGRTVALKALPAELARSPFQRERLRREARAAASLTHPGICTIYALEELNDELFIAAEYVDGHTLRDEISRAERPTPDQLLATARELAAALASAHARGITHRDLKPENVMRATDGRVKILDFGLALFDPSAATSVPVSQLTQPGTVVGTPAYMAPEQLNGGVADPRTDVFSFGVLLYEYATGVHPFEAPTPLARVARVLESEPIPLQRVRGGVPGSFALVVDRAMRKSPADRFASAADIVVALAREDVSAQGGHATIWWRTHQTAAIGLYFLASALAWQIKEWQHGTSDWLFLFVGVAATIAGVFRGHLLFIERMNRGSLATERRRAEPVTFVMDVLIALALGVNGLTMTGARPLAAVLTIALAVGIALGRLVVERSTTSAAFGEAP